MPELAEAAARTGEVALVRAALQWLSERTRAAPSEWALGIEARVRALLSEGEAAERCYRESIDRLGRTRVRAQLARAHLLYGEWLRRQGRRLDARAQVRTAHGQLEAMGVEAFAERASRELQATGETARKRTGATREALTAQEAMIARLAGAGLSNPEIGARLSISARTVQYHLGKVFAKLAISSRGQLDRALASDPAATRPAQLVAPPAVGALRALTGQSRWPLADANARRREPDLAENAEMRAVQLPRAVKGILMSAASTNLPTPDGPGSVSGAPNLPAGFTDTFTSRYIDTGALRQHAVTGGEGPPLLLVHGWPQTWYQWRLVMPTLARDFRVVAVDQRGIGLSGKPEDGYDTGTLANDLVALMDMLGHQRFALVGFDTGMPIAYALAADHPDRVERLVVGEAFLPGLSPTPPLVLPPQLNDRLWHIAFNQLETVNEQLVTGREAIYFGAEYVASAGTNKLPDDTVSYYVDRLASNPEALHGSFAWYRAIHATIAQNQQRKERRLTVPVLAIGGAESSGAMVGDTMQLVADDVQTLIIPGTGHWVAEQAPEELLAALTAFLAPYQVGVLP